MKKKYIHIGIILIGIIFLSLCAFHTSLWFDESYSVAIARHEFSEIWNITGHDVHPPIYYWFLHIVYLIFGNNILVFRLFSVIAVIITGILGYTHIRKDFGERVGILFSFLTFFLPIMSNYAQEIRMYSWSFLIIAVTAIYAYRFYKCIKEKTETSRLKNLIIFEIFSIMACYIHYYALVTTGVINLLLLIFLIKNRKENKKAFYQFLIASGVQVLLYIPWLVFLFSQIKHVHEGFWIEIHPISTPVRLLSFQFLRDLGDKFVFDANTIAGFTISILLYIYLGFKTYKLKKAKKDIKPAYLAFFIYAGVIILMFIASLLIQRPVFFARYLFVMTGLYIFWIAYLLSLENNKIVMGIICTVIVVISSICNIMNIQYFGYKENVEVYSYLEENLKEGDLIIYSDVGPGGVMAAVFPEVDQVFLNDPTWDIDEAYKAYAPAMKISHNLGASHDWSFLDEYTGRIWLIDRADMYLYNAFPKENTKVLGETKCFYTKYHDYSYGIMLIEKYK